MTHTPMNTFLDRLDVDAATRLVLATGLALLAARELSEIITFRTGTVAALCEALDTAAEGITIARAVACGAMPDTASFNA